MCRLFGLRAAEPALAVRDLLTATNSLARQSQKHPDGWGIATFSERAGSAPKLVRSTQPAHADALLAASARALRHPAMIAHVRKASVGKILIRNTHPFAHEGWAFAHNGTIQEFEKRRKAIERATDPALRRLQSGETDSESGFLLFLTYLGRSRERDPLLRAQGALTSLARWVIDTEPAGLEKPSSLNVICSNGDQFLALRTNKELVFATGTRSDRPRRARESVDELVVASEPTGPHRGWRKLRNRTGVAIDSRLRLSRFAISTT